MKKLISKEEFDSLKRTLWLRGEATFGERTVFVGEYIGNNRTKKEKKIINEKKRKTTYSPVFDKQFNNYYKFQEFAQAIGEGTDIKSEYNDFKAMAWDHTQKYGLAALSECFEVWCRKKHEGRINYTYIIKEEGKPDLIASQNYTLIQARLRALKVLINGIRNNVHYNLWA